MPSGGSIVSNTYTWDGEGNMRSKTEGTLTTSYQYDHENRLITVTDFLGQNTGMTYDADGNLTQTSYTGGTVEKYTYGSSTELTQIATTLPGATTPAFSFAYSYIDPATNVHTGQRYSVTDVHGITTTYTYDANGRLTGATVPTPPSGSYSYAYGYDANGNMTNNNGTALTYNAQNQLTTMVYTYDMNGNQTASPSPAYPTPGTNAFTYNDMNQTTSITPSGGSSVAMQYQGPGQALRTQAGGTGYSYTQGHIGSQTTGGNTSTFVTTPDGTPIEMILSNPWGCPSSGTCSTSGFTTYVYAHDGLGSVVAVIATNGTVQRTYAYDPWGKTTATPGGTDPNPFRYIGGVYDSAAGLYKLGARYYDPSVGRFTQLDPMGGQYAYAGDDPINLLDQSGYSPKSPCGAHPISNVQPETYGWGWFVVGHGFSFRINGCLANLLAGGNAAPRLIAAMLSQAVEGTALAVVVAPFAGWLGGGLALESVTIAGENAFCGGRGVKINVMFSNPPLWWAAPICSL